MTNRELVAEKIDPHHATDEEKRFLQDRNMLPADVPRVPVTFRTHLGETVSNDPEHYASVRAAESEAFQEELRSQVESRATELAKQMVMDMQHGQMATQGENFGTATGVPDRTTAPGGAQVQLPPAEPQIGSAAYYNAMERDELEAALAQRELATDGSLRDLRARLRSDDRARAHEADAGDAGDLGEQ